MDKTRASVYSPKDLLQMHKANARMVRAKEPKGTEIIIDEWFLRVSNTATQLVTPYRYRRPDAPGNQRADTYTVAL